MPVLAGFVPGFTVTVSSDEFPGATEFGLAAPTPEGLVCPLQGLKLSLVFRGLGAPVAKSTELLSVSLQPPLTLRAAVVFVSAATAVPSAQLAVPYPTKSTTLTPNGQPLPVKAVVLFVKATLALVALMAVVPVASGAGKGVVPPAPAAS